MIAGRLNEPGVLSVPDKPALNYSSLKLIVLHCSIISVNSFDVRFSTSIFPLSVVMVTFFDERV